MCYRFAMIAQTDYSYCQPLTAATGACPATDSAYRSDSANYVAMASSTCHLYSSYNCYVVPLVVNVLVADASVADPSGPAVSAGHKLHFATVRSAIGHARNRISRCSVETTMDIADFDYSSYMAGKNPCNSIRSDERAPIWECFCLSSD